MATDYPYMLSAGNIPGILERIREAGTPSRFTIDFLQTKLGFKSSNDRAMIKVLKSLGMLTPSGDPTPRYNEYKDESRAGEALAAGLREGWKDVFLADQNAQDRSLDELKGMFKTLTGKSENVAYQMARTFKQLADQADWSVSGDEAGSRYEGTAQETTTAGENGAKPKLRTDGALTLHNDIHIHLPTSTDVAVYTAVFRALRQELIDG